MSIQEGTCVLATRGRSGQMQAEARYIGSIGIVSEVVRDGAGEYYHVEFLHGSDHIDKHCLQVIVS